MHFGNLTPAGKERVARGMRKRWALYTSKPKEKPAPTPEVKRQPCIDANHCQGDRSCPFPPLFAGRCRQHARDATAEESSVGTARAMLREYGMVESEAHEAQRARRRECRSV